MQSFTILCFFGVFAVATCETYTNEFDGIDVDEVLGNPRLVEGYFSCMMEKGPCTPMGLELRKHLREGMETDCAKCTDSQKSAARKTIKFFINNKPDMWNAICEKYDPNNILRGQHEKEFKEMKQ